MLAGQRWDLDVTEPLDFSPGWEEALLADVARRGTLHTPTGSDYFTFSRDFLTEIPAFTIGRAGWDNWMIYHAVKSPWPVFDASGEINIVHQNHDYSHLPGGQIHYKLPESKKNVALAGGEHKMYLLLDVNDVLKDGKGARKPLSWIRFVRRIERMLEPQGQIRGIHGRIFRMVRRYRKRLMNG
jgi:hypothetical protein